MGSSLLYEKYNLSLTLKTVIFKIVLAVLGILKFPRVAFYLWDYRHGWFYSPSSPWPRYEAPLIRVHDRSTQVTGTPETFVTLTISMEGHFDISLRLVYTQSRFFFCFF
jgi:hypothetical protein